MEEQQGAVKQSEDYNAYMRQYVRGYYAKNKDELCMRRNSQNYKKKYNVPNEISVKYGYYLSNVMKLKELIKTIPRELVDEVLREELQEKEYKENMP